MTTKTTNKVCYTCEMSCPIDEGEMTDLFNGHDVVGQVFICHNCLEQERQMESDMPMEDYDGVS